MIFECRIVQRFGKAGKWNMRQRKSTLGVLVLIAALTATLAAKGQEIVPAREYRKCMALARANPELGFGRATSWLGLGGSDAAHHCQAVALVQLGQYGEGARRFEALAQAIRAAAPFRAELFAQAAQAWLLAGQPARAEDVLTSALGLDANNPELYVDRAQAAAALGNWKPAADDLSRALAIDPGLVDALVFRASAHRHLGRAADAEADAEQALRLDPGNAEASLESGILHRQAGRKAESRARWLAVIRGAPGTPAARLAREYLQRMDGPER